MIRSMLVVTRYPLVKRLLVLSSLVVGVLLLAPPHSAAALNYGHDWSGRDQYHGYFSNTLGWCNTTNGSCGNACPWDSQGDGSCNGAGGPNTVLPPDTDAGCGGSSDALPKACIRNVDDLVALLKKYNNDKSNIRLHTSSGFIVQTLLGRDGAEANNNGGRDISDADWADLTDRLKAESDAGRICWGVSQTCKYKSDIRTFSLYLTDHGGNADVTYYDSSGDPQNDPAIIFLDKNGNPIYVLFRTCANPGGTLKGLPPVQKKPPVKSSCDGTPTVDPALPDPNMSITVTASVDYTPNGGAGTAFGPDTFFIRLSGPGRVNITRSTGNPSINGNGTSATYTATFPPQNMGDYNIDYGTTGSVAPVSGGGACSGKVAVTDQPYFSVVGGDIVAGEGMDINGGSCVVPNDKYAGVVSWNRDGGSSGNNFNGAGSQDAAIVLDHIQDFVTAQGSGPPESLAFANTAKGDVTPGQGLYGGYFGGNPYTGNGIPCVRDYFAGVPASSIQNGNISITAHDVANDTSQAIYVKGNVYIHAGPGGKDGIKFSGTYPSLSDIPSYNVIVQGNIYISPDVTQLDGLYVAEPTGPNTGGIIYTCTSAPFTAQPLDSSLNNNCNNTSLTFNGAVVARQVHFLRSTGTVTTTPAETINFTPEIWLTTPPDAVSGSGGASAVNSITSLPPVL